MVLSNELPIFRKLLLETNMRNSVLEQLRVRKFVDTRGEIVS